MILEKIITFYYQERNPMLKKSNPSRICTKKKKKKNDVTLIVMKLNNIKENKNQTNKQGKTKES